MRGLVHRSGPAESIAQASGGREPAGRAWMTAAAHILLRVYLVPLLACSLLACNSLGAEAFEWRTATPESQGMYSAKLDALQRDVAGKKTRAFLVVRNDRIVHECYAEGQTAQTKQGTASLAKAIVGGVSLAVAINDGRIALDDPAARWVPQWKEDARKSKITVRHLGAHASGIDDSHNREAERVGLVLAD